MIFANEASEFFRTVLRQVVSRGEILITLMPLKFKKFKGKKTD